MPSPKPVTIRQLADTAFLDAVDQFADRISPEMGKAIKAAIAVLIERNAGGDIIPTREIQRAVINAVSGSVGEIGSVSLLVTGRVEPGWQGFVAAMSSLSAGPESPLIYHTRAFLRAMDRLFGPGVLDAIGSDAVAKADWYQARAVAIARQTSAALVRDVTESLRHSIREAEARAWAESLEQPALRKLIRDTGIGLTTRQMKIVQNKAARMGIRTGTKAYEKLIRQAVNARVKLIAAQEANQTAIRTQMAHFRSLAERGVPITGLEADAYFKSRTTGELSRGPLQHVRCVCTVRATRNPETGEGYLVEWVARRVGNTPCPVCDGFDGTFKRPIGESSAEPTPTPYV